MGDRVSVQELGTDESFEIIAIEVFTAPAQNKQNCYSMPSMMTRETIPAVDINLVLTSVTSSDLLLHGVLQ